MCTGTPGWDRVVACLESDTRTEQHNDALYIPTAAAGKGDTEVESMGRSEVMTDDGHVVTHVELNAVSGRIDRVSRYYTSIFRLHRINPDADFAMIKTNVVY